MEHQNWEHIVFNSKTDKELEKKNKEKQNKLSNFTPSSESFKVEAPKNLGQLIAQARNAKKINQKSFASELQISTTILSRWETNKETPNNSEIAKIEKKLGVKLPRCKKVKNDDV